MKISKILTLSAIFLMAASSSVAMTQEDVKAASVATTNASGIARLYTADGKLISNRALAPKTDWAVGKVITIDGTKMYQVATSEYLKASDATLTGDTVQTAATNSAEINNAETAPAKNGQYTPNISNINKYFVAYVNALHQANGTSPVHSTNDLISYAGQRADQQDGNHLDHSTAARNMSECLSGAGYNYIINHNGAKSDKEVAYFLLKEWYDEDNCVDPLGTLGHFGHRSSLIYGGPNVGLNINDKNSAYEADWDINTLDKAKALYNFTGSNPNTKFISEDSVQ
ncbi:SLAP domain-containing protein [Companilactobacillus sp. FL22-1]|uniref:SLAP domain-containing protein n=1 Tax=Companilactobacillus sp. FL22-1 TaxID=3373892 RepID=UPI003754E47C